MLCIEARAMVFLSQRQRGKKIMSFRESRAFLVGSALSALLVVGSVQGQQATTAQSQRLSKIEIAGLQRYTHAQIVATSGLQIGQPIAEGEWQ
jgi:high-affinity K+ transport system ATPase subunit B